MKKFFFTLGIVLMAIFAVEAKTVTFDFKTNDYGLERKSGNASDGYLEEGQQITLDGVTLTFNGGWRLWTDGLREYYKTAGTAFTVSAEGNVTEVSWKVVSGATFALEGTTDNITSWTGDAASVKFVNTSAANKAVETITVTYTEGGSVDPEPEPTEEVIVSFTDGIGQFTYAGTVVAGYTGQKYDENKTTPTNTITFPNSYVSNGEVANYVTIAPAEGGFKAGDVVTMCAYYNNSDPKDARLAIYNTNDEQLFLSELFINGKLVAGVPQPQSYTLTADAEYLRIGRANLTGESATRVNLLTLDVVRGGASAPALTPATWYGAEQFVTENDLKEWTAFVYGITRNADKTLTYEMEFANSVTGLVVEINDGDYRAATAEGLKYTYTTADTHEDGETINGFFWIKYANGVTRIDYTYTVGAENEKPAMPEKPAETATARILAYGLNVAQDGDNYTFTYTANIAGTEANLVFYADGVEAGKVAIDAPKAGVNTAVVAKSAIPAGTLTWAVELKAAPVAEFGKYFEGQNLMKCHLAIDNSTESDYFGRMYIADRAGSALGGIYVYNQDFTLAAENILAGQEKWQSIGRPIVGQDGTVYIADWGDAHGGIYVMDPTTLTATNFFVGTQNTSTGVWTNAEGVAMGSSTAAVGIYGSGANTVLYAMNEDAVAGDVPLYAHGVNVYQIGQEDGTVLKTWDKAPTLTFALQDNAAQMFIINANEHGAFFSSSRSTGNNAAGARSLQFYNTKGERTFVALPEGATADLTGSLGGGCAVSQDLSQLAIVDGAGNILVYSIEWTDDTPALTFVEKFTTEFGALGTLVYDYAGNLIATAGSNYGNTYANKLVAFAVPTTDNTVVVPAKKALTVEGEAVIVDMGPIDSYWFATTDVWADDKESSASWDAETETILVDIVLYKCAQWQGQVKVNTTLLPTPFSPEADKEYTVTLKMKANQAVNGVTLKYHDDVELFFENAAVKLPANEEYVYTKDFTGNVGNNIFVFDFGFAAANTQIEIYEIEFSEKSGGEGTGLDNVNNNVEVKKVMIDGQVYIIRDGVRYNVMGMQVR